MLKKSNFGGWDILKKKSTVLSTKSLTLSDEFFENPFFIALL